MEDINTKIDDDGATADGRLSAAEYNDRNEELENAVTRSGQALASASTLQLSESIFLNSIKGHAFEDVGVVNVVDLRPVSGPSGVKIPTTYDDMEGALVSFKPAVNNTGPVTLNIGQTSGIGANALVLSTDGSALVGGELDTTQTAQAQYNASSGEWELLPWSIPAASISLPLIVSQGGTGATTKPDARTSLEVPHTSFAIGTTGGILTGGGTLASPFNITATETSEVEAKDDTTTESSTVMTPRRVWDAIGEATLGLGGIANVQTFTAGGTYTKFNDDVNKILVISTAGGGGGGSVTAVFTEVAAGGGGAGASAISFIDVSGVASLTVTIGAGGAGGVASVGSPGGDTVLADGGTPWVTVPGGLGGVGSSSTTFNGGLVGGGKVTPVSSGEPEVSTAEVLIDGMQGDNGSVYNSETSLSIDFPGETFNLLNQQGLQGGRGGSSFWADGGRGSAHFYPSLDNPAYVGEKGSGGGGGYRFEAGTASRPGLAGGNGYMLILEYL